MRQQDNDTSVSLGDRRLLGLITLAALSLGTWLLVSNQAGPRDLPKPTERARSAPSPTDEIAAVQLPDQRTAVDTYGDLRALARRDPAAFAATTARFLERSDAPSERLAALRAIYDTKLGDPITALAKALADPGSDPTVQQYCFDRLVPECPRDGRARTAMIGFLRLQPADAEQRGIAFAGVLHWGDTTQVANCLPLLHAETAPDVVLAGLAALQASADPAIRRKAESLHWRHHDAKVRQRLRTLK